MWSILQSGDGHSEWCGLNTVCTRRSLRWSIAIGADKQKYKLDKENEDWIEWLCLTFVSTSILWPLSFQSKHLLKLHQKIGNPWQLFLVTVHNENCSSSPPLHFEDGFHFLLSFPSSLHKLGNNRDILSNLKHPQSPMHKTRVHHTVHEQIQFWS